MTAEPLINGDKGCSGGLQAWDDKRQGTGLTVAIPQLCALPPEFHTGGPRGKGSTVEGSLRVSGLMLAMKMKLESCSATR